MKEKAPENIEATPKIEWGPDLGLMSWNDTQEKVAELNANLSEGEKAWRLPTSTELRKALSDQFRDEKRNDFRESTYYWCDSENENGCMYYRNEILNIGHSKTGKNLTRFVR
jgi:formylglycine-generating enzyme required for sulfatase activity